MKRYWNLETIPPDWFSRSLLKCPLVDDSAKTVFLSYPEVKQLTAVNRIAAFTPRGGNVSAAPSRPKTPPWLIGR